MSLDYRYELIWQVLSIKHASNEEDNARLTGKGAPDVVVDYYYVARAIGQAVIQCCSPCRLAGLHAYCPIRGLVIDAAAINTPADTSDEANPPLSFLERAHFPSDPPGISEKHHILAV